MFRWLLSPPAGAGDSADIDRMDDSLTREVAALLGRAGVPTFHRTLPRLHAELVRARRYNRPLTLALIGDARASDPDRAPTGSPLDPGSPLVPVVIAPVLCEVTRTIDICTYASTLAQCVVVMPEADAAQARKAMSRMAQHCMQRLQVPVTMRSATFPDDGLTLEELMRAAAAAMDTNPVRVPITAPRDVRRAMA